MLEVCVLQISEALLLCIWNIFFTFLDCTIIYIYSNSLTYLHLHFYLYSLLDLSSNITKPNLGLLAWSTAKPIYWHWVVAKESIVFIAGHQARNIGSSCSKDLNSLLAFREGFLQATLGVWVVRCLIRLWTFFWLAGGEVTGLGFGNQHHQPSGSNHSRVHILVISMQVTSSA